MPSFYGITVGMWLTGTGIGSNTTLPGAAGEGGAVANTQVIAVYGNTITISYVPAGFGGTNQGTLGFHTGRHDADLLRAAGEHQLPGADDRHRPQRDGNPFTYAYEFGTSKTTLEQQLSWRLAILSRSTAPPCRARRRPPPPARTSWRISPRAPATPAMSPAAGPASTPATRARSATSIRRSRGRSISRPNMTFDFTEIQYEGKTVAQAEADWAAQFNAITANAAGTPVVVLPMHDYGAAAWNTTTDSPTGSPYTTQMYTDFIAQAYATAMSS